MNIDLYTHVPMNTRQPAATTGTYIQSRPTAKNRYNSVWEQNAEVGPSLTWSAILNRVIGLVSVPLLKLLN